MMNLENIKRNLEASGRNEWLIRGVKMNLEEAIQWFQKQQNRKAAYDPDRIAKSKGQLEFLRTQKEVIAKAESAEEVRANEKKAAEVSVQEDREMLRAAYRQPNLINLGEVRTGYRGAVRAAYATANLVTSAVYPSSSNVDGLSWEPYKANQTLREQMEAEYRIKLKDEIEKLRKEMRGESGQSVEVDLLGQSRKFKLEGE